MEKIDLGNGYFYDGASISKNDRILLTTEQLTAITLWNDMVKGMRLDATMHPEKYGLKRPSEKDFFKDLFGRITR